MNISKFLSHKIIIAILAICCLISLFLHLYQINFPPLNSDEAAFGYNTYSLLKTGKDEYGNILPSRFKSFGEYKLPVMGYLSIPFVATMGLSDVSTRMVVYLIGIFTPILFYFLTKELFQKKEVALIAAFLSAFSPWIQIISRHAHEAVVAYFFITLSFIFLLKFQRNFKLKYLIYFSLFHGLALFSHHITKPFSLFFAVWIVIIYVTKKSQFKAKNLIKFILTLAIPVILFGITELMNPTTRISNLLFYNTSGFTSSIEELRKEHDSRLLHNKLTKSVIQLTNQYVSYFSPQFLVIEGDKNERFGFEGISPISFIEFIFIFIGLYFLFKNKDDKRFLLLGLLLISPLSASFSWQESSLTRALYMIVPILLISSYGLYYFLNSIQQNKIRYFAILKILGIYFFFLFFTWDFYFYHYTQKPEAIKAWSGGYKELGSYLTENYDKYDKFYITNKLGQPYIFTLFYTKYPPEKYQTQANLSSLDEYGFGQVERFDKYEFNFAAPKVGEKAAYIGYPEDFNGTGIDESKVKKITVNKLDIFWIYTQ